MSKTTKDFKMNKNYRNIYANFIFPNYNLFSIFVRIFCCLIFIYTILITAWFADDSFILFRHVVNFVNGGGITFNIGQRMQGFTSPLWFFVLGIFSFLTNDYLMTFMVVNICTTLLGFLVLLYVEYKINNNNIPLFSPLILLVFSYSYIDFSSSGLENAMAHLLVSVLFLIVASSNQKYYRLMLFVIFALLMLTRLDYLFLILPFALLLAFDRFSLNSESIKKLIYDVSPGILVIVVWIVFSLFYFGFPLPNTYYAKLEAGYALEDYLVRGMWYFWDLRFDPSSFIIIITGLLVAAISLKKELIALAMGMILYMMYIVYIGGDFMRGRFFSVLVLLSIGLMIVAFSKKTMHDWIKQACIIGVIISITIVAFVEFRFPFMSTLNYSGLTRDPERVIGIGIQDERGRFYGEWGLFSPNRNWPEINVLSIKKPVRFQYECGLLGLKSLTIIDLTFMIDLCGLTDPLIARLPAVKREGWRVGHAARQNPTDYGHFAIGEISRLSDENISDFAIDIDLVTKGELFSTERLYAIWRLNAGFYSNIDVEIYYKYFTTFMAITPQKVNKS